MSIYRISALVIVIFYLAGLAAWVANFGIAAWVAGLIFGVVSLLTCLTSKEGTPVFTMTMIFSGSSLLYLLIGGLVFFLNLRDLHGP